MSVMRSVSSPLQSASLETIDLSLLQQDSHGERARLYHACQTQGFFYLDLRKNERFLQDYNGLLDLMREYFGRDLAAKMQDNRQSDTHGWAKRTRVETRLSG